VVWDSDSYFFIFFFDEAGPGYGSIILGTGGGIYVDGWCLAFIQVGNFISLLHKVFSGWDSL